MFYNLTTSIHLLQVKTGKYSAVDSQGQNIEEKMNHKLL